MEVLLYAPTRLLVDYSVGFLWLMAVGTIICASLWSDITAPNQSDERYDEFSPKVFPCNPLSVVYDMYLKCIIVYFSSCLE